ncbi:MAG: hypothetical protein GY809_01185 [Planctomycetes bacterium]|nr:hypothetical protein [Planctomycetota bacterium]
MTGTFVSTRSVVPPAGAAMKGLVNLPSTTTPVTSTSSSTAPITVVTTATTSIPHIGPRSNLAPRLVNSIGVKQLSTPKSGIPELVGCGSMYCWADVMEDCVPATQLHSSS